MTFFVALESGEKNKKWRLTLVTIEILYESLEK